MNRTTYPLKTDRLLLASYKRKFADDMEIKII